MSIGGEMAVEKRRAAPGMDEDERLVRAAAEGERGAFEELVRQYARQVGAVARRLLDNPEDAADAVQETFLRAYQNLSRYRGSGGVRGWLLSIATNVCRDRRRRFWRWRRFLNRDAPALAPPPEDPRAAAEGRLSHAELEAAVRALPEGLRTPFVLRFFEDLTGAEIAEIVGCPESTVWSRIYAARRELRKRLGGEPGGAEMGGK